MWLKQKALCLFYNSQSEERKYLRPLIIRQSPAAESEIKDEPADGSANLEYLFIPK